MILKNLDVEVLMSLEAPELKKKQQKKITNPTQVALYLFHLYDPAIHG